MKRHSSPPNATPNPQRRSLLIGGGLAALLAGCGGGGSGGGQQDGAADPSGASIGRFGTATVATIADLRAVSKDSYQHAVVNGANAPGDGGNAVYDQAPSDGSIDNGNTTVIAADGGMWKKRPTDTQARGYQVTASKSIQAPDGSRHVIKSVTMFDYLFVSTELRTDYKYRSIYQPAGKGPGTGISEPTYYARIAYIGPANVEAEMRKAMAAGVNQIRVGVEPAMLLASVEYVDPQDGQTYLPDMKMLDEIVRCAGSLGLVVQLQGGQDWCTDADIASFMAHLALRYWDCPWVWIDPSNEPFGAYQNGAYVRDTSKWKARMDTLLPALRNTLPNGRKFLNPVVIGPTDYSHDLDAVEAIISSDTVFTSDPNLIIGIHVYAELGEDNFRTTRLAGDTTAWVQYANRYCIYIEEHGISNFTDRYDPNLDPGVPSSDLTQWGSMQSFSTDFCQWVADQTAHGSLHGMNAFLWRAWIPGIARNDDNAMYRNDGSITTWGQLYEQYYLSAASASA